MTTKLDPVTPGEILKHEFLEPLGLSQNQLAKAIDVPANRINAIVNGKREVTPDTALRLGRYFSTSPEFWLNLQHTHDLRIAERKTKKIIRLIKPRDTSQDSTDMELQA